MNMLGKRSPSITRCAVMSAFGLTGLLGCAGESASAHTDAALGPAITPPDAGTSIDANSVGADGRGDAAAFPQPEGGPSLQGDAATKPDAASTACADGTRDDIDGDGFSVRDGDCNDCLKTVNPAAIDVPGNKIDEDCSGSADEPESTCDERLAIDSSDAKDAARALGLCSFPAASSRAWGVLSARFIDARAEGSLRRPRAVGLLTSFGAAKPRAGASLLALSTGVARAPGQPDYEDGCDFPIDIDFDTDPCDLFDCQGAPPPTGYPKPSTSCGGASTTRSLSFDSAALELTIRVPSNASGLSFDSIFYTHEFPDYICSDYNDYFVVFKEPKAAVGDDSNILFDKNHDPIGVNSALFAVCDPKADTSKPFACEQGTGLLRGTGYGPNEVSCDAATTRHGGGATGWLKTTAPVEPGGTITLRFALWDTADPVLDSTALLDNFSWSTFEGTPEKPVVTKTELAPPLL